MKRHEPELEAPAPRTRTPPDLKWLLNERAALAGVVEKAELTLAGLRAKQGRLEHQLTKVQFLMERAQCAQSRAQASVEALDATMGLVSARLEPTSAGVVDAWAGKYGKRGALGAFVEQALRAAAPEPLTTTVLMNLAARQFGIAFPLAKDRRNFNKSVSSSLRGLHQRGLIDPLHDRGRGSHGLWRWKAPAPSLDELRARAAEYAREGALAWR
jgi:hypothetical protein